MGEYELITPTKLKVNKNPTGLWDLSEDVIPLQPIEAWGQGNEFTALAVYNHPSGKEFYVRKKGETEGILSEDADPVTIYGTTDEIVVPSRHLYTVLKGETIWEIARRLKCDPMELMENNGIDDHQSVKEGDVLLMPHPRPEARNIRYETDGYPKKMHVSHEHGTHKVAFGKAVKHEDLIPVSRHYKYQTTVEIVKKAYVPIGDQTYGFYMDGLAAKTGQAIGFIQGHLTDGESLLEPDVIKPAVLPVVTDTLIEEARKKLAELQEPPEVVDTELEFETRSPWRTTFVRFEDDPRHYVLKDDYIIVDYDERRRSLAKLQYSEVWCEGAFIGPDGHEYYRPVRDQGSYHWYGIPPKMLDYYKDVFSIEVEPYERVLAHLPLTPSMKAFDVLARNVSSVRRLRIGYDKLKHK